MIEVIKRIINDEGKEILQNENRFMAYISDLSPKPSEGKNMIRNLVRCGMLKEYLAIEKAEKTERNSMLTKLNLRLKDEFGMKEEWITESNIIFNEVFGWQIEFKSSIAMDESARILEQLTAAMQYAKNKELDKAELCLKQLVDEGNPIAMAKLGELYLHPTHSKWRRDKYFENTAIDLLKKSAKEGCTEAYYQLAFFHRIGLYGFEKSDTISFEYLKKMVERGDMKAATLLALCYYNGYGTEKIVEKAVELFEIAADFGEKVAMEHLADFYSTGNGVNASADKAKFWREKAEQVQSNKWENSVRYFPKQIEIVQEKHS